MMEGQYSIIIHYLVCLEIGLNPCMPYAETSTSLLAWLSHVSGLKTYSKKTTKQIGDKGLRTLEYGMSICCLSSR